MSYCGTCGGFYNPACPHWPKCAPAPNPHEERLAALVARAVADAAQIGGMLAENQHCQRMGLAAAYSDDAFFAIAKNLRSEPVTRDSNGENGGGNG